jgi:PAS domain S-box-containing protein
MPDRENIFEIVANYTYDWETWFSESGEVHWINPAVERITGYSVRDCYEMPDYPQPLLHPDDRDRLRRLLDSARKGSSGNDVEFRIQRRDGDIAWGAVSWQPISDADGKLMGFRTSVRDISERKQAEDALKVAMKEAENASSAKSRFLAAVSHDLRQPIQAISLYIGALSQMNQDKSTLEILENIRLCLDNSNELLDDLVDISRLDAGIVVPELRDFAIADVFETLERSFSSTAEERGLELSFMPTSLFCCSDPAMLTRILQNLVSNALRYTQKGRVLVGCRPRGREVAIEVWDTGIGIAEAQLEEIFEEFYQIHNPHRDRRQGVGLGLAIVKRQAALMGAKVGARSQLGRGSVFRIVVQQALTEAAPENLDRPEALDSNLEGISLIALDDEPQQLTALSSFLRLKGLDVLSGESEEDVLDKLDGQEPPPQVIVADYRLRGDVTGAVAIARLRDFFGCPIPGIIITGDTEPQRIAEAKASGCRLLHKPVDPEHLLNAIRDCIGR